MSEPSHAEKYVALSRIGKVLQFIAGLTVIMDILGEKVVSNTENHVFSFLEVFSERLQRLYISQRANINFVGKCGMIYSPRLMLLFCFRKMIWLLPTCIGINESYKLASSYIDIQIGTDTSQNMWVISSLGILALTSFVCCQFIEDLTHSSFWEFLNSSRKNGYIWVCLRDYISSFLEFLYERWLVRINLFLFLVISSIIYYRMEVSLIDAVKIDAVILLLFLIPAMFMVFCISAFYLYLALAIKTYFIGLRSITSFFDYCEEAIKTF